MSGGAFHYAFCEIGQFADELRVRLDESAPAWDDPAVAAKLREIADLAHHTAALAREAEWLYSGDCSEESFTRRVGDLEQTELARRVAERVSLVTAPSTR